MRTAQLFLRAEHALGEGPFVHAGRLWWVDILGCRLWSCSPAGDDVRAITAPAHLGCALPWPGGFLCGTAIGIGVLALDGAFAVLPHAPALPTGQRWNDGKLDPAGRAWIGSMAYDLTRGAGSVVVIERDGRARTAFTGTTISNGLAWDDGRMLYIDTATRRIDAFRYDVATGDITDRRVFATIPEQDGWPDGCCRDDRGRLWVACWGGSQVLGIDLRSGAIVARIAVPAPQPSSCCLLADGRLLITTARDGLDAQALATAPLSGSLFITDLPE